MLATAKHVAPIRGLLVMMAVVAALLVTSATASATEGNLNYGTATVDGDPGEWDTDLNGADYYAPMYQAGKPDKPIVAYLYLRYDCETETMFVYVNSPTYPIDPDDPDDEIFVKIDGDKRVHGDSTDFAFVYDNADIVGWEASFSLAPGTYDIQAHHNFLASNSDAFSTQGHDRDRSETASTLKTRHKHLRVSPSCDCSGAMITATVCEDLNGNGICDDGEPRFNADPTDWDIPVKLVPDSPTTDNPILIGATDGNGQVIFDADQDGYEVPGGYTLTVHDAYLLAQGYVPTTPTSHSFSVALCANIEREFGYQRSALGTIGDLIWYDADDDKQQDEWYDSNDNNMVDLYPVGAPIPLTEFEWIDVNKDGSYDGLANEGEVNKCGIPGVTVDMTSPAATTTTNLLGYYRFYNLDLEETYTTSINPTDAALLAGAEEWFNITNDDQPGKCASNIPPTPTVAAASFNQVSMPVGASAIEQVDCSLALTTQDSDTLTEENNIDLTLDYPIVCSTTVPVSLSYFQATGSGGDVTFDWSTATETGNAGFNLYVETAAGLQQINSELIRSAVIDSVEPQDYSYAATGVAGDRFFIEQVDVDGTTETFGPFALGSSYGSRVDPGPGAQTNKVYLPWIVNR